MQNYNKNNKKIIFIWIPKCAGNTIESVFKLEHQVKQHDKPNWKYCFKNKTDVTFGHADIELLLKEKILSNDFYNNSFKFCIVRNPYDRAVSLFFYCKLNKKYTFKSWIEYLYQNKNNIPKNSLVNETWFKDDNNCSDLCNKWNPMYTWIPHDIDKIYYFENLDEIFDDVIKNITNTSTTQETSCDKSNYCGYWKYSNSSNIYWSNSYPILNKDIEFNNEKDFFDHRIKNNFRKDWSNIETISHEYNGCYWRYSNSSIIYWSNSYSSLDKDIEFNNEKDFFDHRIKNGFPKKWSNVLTVFKDNDQLIIPCKNKSKHKHYTSYYDEDTQEKVYEIYKADFISFKYSKKLKV